MRSDRTHRRYAEYVRLHLVPELGDVPLRSLRPQSIQELYSQKIAAGLSARSVLHLHRVLRRGLSQAQRWDLIDQTRRTSSRRGRNPVK